MEKTKSLYASTEEVCAALGIGRTRLMDLKASNELVAGKHWVYKTGRKSSPLGWDLEAVREWQRTKAQQISEAPIKASEEIESYQTMGV